MKTIEQIIHMDDWKRIDRVSPGDMVYTESEVRVMMRRYGEECVEELWKSLRYYIDNEEWSRAIEIWEDIKKEISNQVII